MPDGDAWAAFSAPASPAASSAAVTIQPAPTAAPAPGSTTPAIDIKSTPAAAPADDDGWAAFSAPTSAAPGPGDAAPWKYDEYNAAGQWIGGSDEGYQSPLARLHVEPSPTPSAATPAPATAAPSPADATPAPAAKTGYLANLAAGGNAAIADTLGLPVDLATGGINLATRGINAVTGTDIAPIVDPVGGSGTIKRAMGLIDANPDDVRPAGIGQEIARGVGGGAVSAMVPAGVTAGLVRQGSMAVPVATRVLSVLGDATPQNALLGAASGGAGQVAASVVPDRYKPLAALVGGVAGVGVPVAGVAAVRGASRAASRYLAPAVGRVNPLLDVAGDAPVMADGAPINALAGGPLVATDNQARLAGERLASMAQDPAAVRATLATQGPPSIADNPTLAQLTRDPGLLASERGISRTVPGAQAPFIARAAGQNDARVGTLRGVAEGGDPAALPAALQEQASNADAAAAARLANLQAETGANVAGTDEAGQAHISALQDATQESQAQRGVESQGRLAGLHDTAATARAAMRGDLPAGSDALVGATAREAPAAAQAEAHAVRGRLYDAVDPDDKLALTTTPAKEAAAAIRKEMPEDADPMVGKEKAIFDAIGAWPDVRKFSNIRAMRSRITDQIRRERGPDGDPQAVRRLSMLLQGVEHVMDDGAVTAEIAPAAPRAPGPSVAAPSVGGEVFTPSGRRVGVNYELADARDLVTSHDDDMRPNPAFPQELQPRERTRTASELQVADIAHNLIPEKLGASATVSDGAPIVGPDGIVESGNGRVMGLRRAYAADGPRAQAYRAWLESQGHDLGSMQQPVLIRRRTTEMSPEERVAFASEGSTPTTLAMSSPERATGDARRMTDSVLQTLRPGAVTDPVNQPFVRNFLHNVVEPGQEGSFASADGSLSKEGAARVEAALVQRAYGDQGLTAALTETTDPTARVLAGAMRDAAGPMARLKAGIEAGAVDPQLDLAPGLVEATRVVQQARSKGILLADAVAQQDAFNPISPLALKVLRTAYGENLSGRMSQSRMAEALAIYARRAEQHGATADIFGEKMTAAQMLDGVSSRNGTDAISSAPGYESPNAAAVGRVSVGGGPETRGPGPNAGGQAPSGGSGGRASSARILPQARPLTPNYDPEAIARLRAANAQNVADRARFNDAPGVGQMLRPGRARGEFDTPASMVPNIIVRVGPEGADVAQAYLAAGGSPQVLADTAAYSLRQYAARSDGSLDPGKIATWTKARASFLSVIPEAAARFGAVADAQTALETATKAEAAALADGATADAKALKAATMDAAQALKTATAIAQRTVDEATAAQAAVVRQRQRSAIGKFLGNADPVTQVASILRSPTAVADMRMLAEHVAGDPEAMAGLQRAVAEHILRALKGDAVAAGGSEAGLHGAQLQRFLRLNEPALREVMTSPQMGALNSVVESLERSNLSVAGSKMAGGSDTAQIASAGESAAPSTFLGHFLRRAGNSLTTGGGALIGSVLGGPVGAGTGFLGGLGLSATQAAREAGLRTVDDLVASAMLHPQLAAVLLAKVTPNNQASLGRALVSQLRRISLVSTAVGRQSEGQPAAPSNALLH